MTEPHAAERIVVISYMLWALSVPLAMSFLVILLMRLVLHKLPPTDMVATSWLALGPIGTGALGLMLLGTDAAKVFPAAGLPWIGEVAFGIGAIGGSMPMGIWHLVVLHSAAHDGTLDPNRNVLQFRMVGIYIPHRRLFRCNACASPNYTYRQPYCGGRNPHHRVGGALGVDLSTDIARSLERLPVCVSMPRPRSDTWGPNEGREFCNRSWFSVIRI